MLQYHHKVGERMEHIYSTAERLQQIIRDRGIKQADILAAAQPYCERYGVKLNKSDLSQFVNGKSNPGQWKLTVLALALNVSESWLMGLDVPMERQSSDSVDPAPALLGSIPNLLPFPKTRKVPRLGTIACGEPILAQENIENYDKAPEGVNCDFTLKCKGDSMTGARIHDGDIVYIRLQEEVENGEIAAVLVDDVGESNATLKRVYLYENQIVLQAENPKYSPWVYTGEDMNKVRIIGKAVAFLSEVR